MLKFNKDKFEIFTGWLIVLLIIINILCPVAGIITGVLFMSKNYFSLVLILLSIIVTAYVLTVYDIAKLY